MLQTTVSYMQLNKPQLAQLRAIATTVNTNRSATYAQNILCFAYGECDWEQAQPQERLKKTHPKRVYDFSSTPSIGAKEHFTEVTIQPNPSKGQITILMSGMKESANVQFYLKNTQGQLLIKKQLQSAHSHLNLEHLSQGIYFYEVISAEERIANGKLVIQ